MSKLTWPAWFNGPKGETAIFESADDVPNGWTSGAEKLSVKASEKVADTADEEPKKKPGRPAKADKPLDL